MSTSVIKTSNLKMVIERWNKSFFNEFRNRRFSHNFDLKWLNEKREQNENISVMLYDEKITTIGKQETPELFATCEYYKGIIWNEIFRLEGRTDLLDVKDI